MKGIHGKWSSPSRYIYPINNNYVCHSSTKLGYNQWFIFIWLLWKQWHWSRILQAIAECLEKNVTICKYPEGRQGLPVTSLCGRRWLIQISKMTNCRTNSVTSNSWACGILPKNSFLVLRNTERKLAKPTEACKPHSCGSQLFYELGCQSID